MAQAPVVKGPKGFMTAPVTWIPRPNSARQTSTTSLLQKDVALALDTGRGLQVPLPSAAAADSVLTIARAFGYERRDIAALFQVLAHLASAPVGPTAG